LTLRAVVSHNISLQAPKLWRKRWLSKGSLHL